MGNRLFEDADVIAVGLVNHFYDVFGDVRPPVHHRKQYTADGKVWVYMFLCLCYALEKQFQPFRTSMSRRSFAWRGFLSKRLSQCLQNLVGK
jgi:hypothetical protein